LAVSRKNSQSLLYLALITELKFGESDQTEEFTSNTFFAISLKRFFVRKMISEDKTRIVESHLQVRGGSMTPKKVIKNGRRF